MNTRSALVAIKVKRDGTCIAYNGREVDITKKLKDYAKDHNSRHSQNPMILKPGLYHADILEYPNGEIKSINSLSRRA